VPPYALRPKPGAPVAPPLDWVELSGKDLDSQSYTISNIFKRLGQKEEPLEGFLQAASVA
jgi:bifunctional non-homologous end joining protein LigD